MTNILIIEDDPMVAMLNQQFIEQQPTVTIVGNVRNVPDARHILEQKDVDLLLLDVYLPGTTGIEFLEELHQMNRDISVILITAADDVATVKEAIRYGVVDYLIKPFTFDRFTSAFSKYLDLNHVFNDKEKTNQTSLDKFFNGTTIAQKNAIKNDGSLPKGLSKLTLKKVINQIDEETRSFSTEELANHIRLSRISTKKYLVFLTELEYLKEEMEYRDVGRPITLYAKSNKTHVIEPYL